MDNSQALLTTKTKDTSSDYDKLKAISDYEIKENLIKLKFKNAKLIIKFLKADIFRLIMVPLTKK